MNKRINVELLPATEREEIVWMVKVTAIHLILLGASLLLATGFALASGNWFIIVVSWAVALFLRAALRDTLKPVDARLKAAADKYGAPE